MLGQDKGVDVRSFIVAIIMFLDEARDQVSAISL